MANKLKHHALESVREFGRALADGGLMFIAAMAIFALIGVVLAIFERELSK